MATYGLYLESGPRRRKTMIHVLDLLGCVAVGATTEEAIAATPEAIEAYRGFPRCHGERVAAPARIETRVVEQITEGQWLGNGSPAATFGPDRQPVTPREVEIFLRRFHWFREALAAWAGSRTAAQLDSAGGSGGRPARAVLHHVLAVPGAYLSVPLGSSEGFSAVGGAVERGELALPEALRRIGAMIAERVRATTAEERARVVQRPDGVRTLRKALRLILEHDWEHLVELSRRPGGPAL
ncbi:MAG: hypothetical protein EXR65_06060 [Dehalococcoidia bacterium]|nr:hypothetical protein [Dehalococcoidia bacterium]